MERSSTPLAVLFLTNRWRPVDQARFRRLAAECGDRADCFLVVDQKTVTTAPDVVASGGVAVHAFHTQSLSSALGYGYLTRKGVLPGSMHFPLIDFARRHTFDKYLVVENDVEFTGDWGHIAHVCRAGVFDLLASHVHDFATRPEWWWWDSLLDPEGNRPPREQLRRAFLPFACYSRRALLHADAMHQAGWTGHFEVLMPSLLTMAGMVVTDINTIGSFYVRAAATIQHPTHPTGTFSLRWRPHVTLDEFEAGFYPGVIYHPVKDDWAWVDGQVQRFTP